jgi:hypothetical protein
MSTQDLIEKEVASLPEDLQRKVYHFVPPLRERSENDSFDGLLLSESALRGLGHSRGRCGMGKPLVGEVVVLR